MAYVLMVLSMDFPVWSYGYMLTPQVAIPVLFLATSLMKWNQFSERCYITGSSNHNQRIEQWWGFLRKHHAQYWMNIFQDLKEQDHFSGDLLDKNLIQFTCLEIIEVAYFCYSLIISFMDILFY